MINIYAQGIDCLGGRVQRFKVHGSAVGGGSSRACRGISARAFSEMVWPLICRKQPGSAGTPRPTTRQILGLWVGRTLRVSRSHAPSRNGYRKSVFALEVGRWPLGGPRCLNCARHDGNARKLGFKALIGQKQAKNGFWRPKNGKNLALGGIF